MHGRYEKKKPKKKGGQIALIVLAVILALILVLCGGIYFYYTSMLNKINRAQLIEKDPSPELLQEIGAIIPDTEPETEEVTLPPETTVPETTVPETRPMTADDIVNILVVGQAARPGEDYRMADSTILFTINKYTKTVYVNSVLRDTYVKYPAYRGSGGGKCKFTSAYANAYAKWDVLGAMEVMNLLMEQNFGVEVDYNFEVDFEVFMDCITAINGVELEMTEAETAYMNKQLVKCGYAEMEPGYNSLDGFGALTFARMRKATGDGESDIVRTERQRYLIDRIFSKILYILDTEGLPAVQKIFNSVVPHVTTNMENDEITRLMLDVLPILPELTIEKGSIPIKTTYWGELRDIYDIGREESILLFDEGQNKRLIRAFTEGEATQ